MIGALVAVVLIGAVVVCVALCGLAFVLALHPKSR